MRYCISASKSMCEAACVQLGPIGSYYAYSFNKITKTCEIVAFTQYDDNPDYDCYAVLLSMIIISLNYFVSFLAYDLVTT